MVFAWSPHELALSDLDADRPHIVAAGDIQRRLPCAFYPKINPLEPDRRRDLGEPQIERAPVAAHEHPPTTLTADDDVDRHRRDCRPIDRDADRNVHSSDF